MKYWWVNHKQTARQELAGGYVWSPKREANGNFSQFYENMRRVAPGDQVVSFEHAQVRHCGTVRGYATHAPNPFHAHKVGRNWSDDGWLVPVEWERLAVPVVPKALISELRPLLPVKYSPVSPSTGNGNQKAYLAEISRAAYAIAVGGSQQRYVNTPAVAVEDVIAQADQDVEDVLRQDQTLVPTERQQLVLARRGQGIFRERVLALEPSCRVTRISNPHLLVASHIKPWRSCKDSHERLNGANGLMLAPHIDWLFDRGFITFTDDGNLLISWLLRQEDRAALHIPSSLLTATAFNSDQTIFLEYHRTSIFLKSTDQF